jgi:predicted component of type VI protein secretion system
LPIRIVRNPGLPENDNMKTTSSVPFALDLLALEIRDRACDMAALLENTALPIDLQEDAADVLREIVLSLLDLEQRIVNAGPGG